MQRRLHDYKCAKCDNQFESLEYSKTKIIKCNKCSYDAYQIVSAPAMLKTNFADKTRVPGKKN